MRPLISVLVFLLLAPMPAISADLAKGMAAYDVGDYDTALAECMPLAEQGDAGAQFCVGRLYANGFGVDMNDSEALKWYGLAAAGGHAEAQYNLAVMYANGWGVDMDDVEAARLYRQSAEQGFPLAVHSMAYITSRGIGLEENLQDAYMWYSLSVELGDTTAITDRDDIAEKISEAERTNADLMAKTWLERFEHGALYAGTGD